MLNEITLIGRLGAEPNVKTFESGSEVATMSVATWRSYNKDGQWETVTNWHNVVMWKPTDSVKNLKKGEMVVVSGSIETRKYTNDKNEAKYVTEVVGRVKKVPTEKSNSMPDPTAEEAPPF